MTKLLIYSHDTYGLGNIRRMLGIATHLSKRQPDLSILLISGSPMLHAFRIPPEIDYVKLPCLTRLQTGKYISTHQGVSIEEVLRIRANILKITILGYQPDLFLVDKKPLGLEGELSPALEALKQCQSPPHQILLLRDILDSPEITRDIWNKNGYYDAIDKLYDLVLIVGDQSIFDATKNYKFPQSIIDKTRYCGYLKRQLSLQNVKDTRTKLNLSAKDKLVLVTVGGGADGENLLTCYLKSLQITNAIPEHHSLLLCGSEMPQQQRSQLETIASRCRHVQIREFTNDIMRYMEAADVVISMGGYNTICELLTLKKNAIVVPRTTPVSEQWIRSENMAALGLMQTIHPEQLTPENLAEAVKKEMLKNKKKEPIPHIDMDGLFHIERELFSLLKIPSQTRSTEYDFKQIPFAEFGIIEQAISLAER